MKSNIMIGMTSGLLLMSSIAGAQNYDGKDVALVYADTQKNNSSVVSKTDMNVNNIEAIETVDYPTLSYPETAAFSVEKDKAFYRLSWQVLASENLSYTEVQSSQDGKNFITVGFVTNKGSDYFVPSDKTNTNYFRLVQYSFNTQKHTSTVVKVN
ncbi:MAG TPA: hypothetical protein VNW06_02205 [Cytophagaceae bacterium]|jgi:hypothetical protein|nr:hypothetical protein [Cytophagaceae bacterium]